MNVLLGSRSFDLRKPSAVEILDKGEGSHLRGVRTLKATGELPKFLSLSVSATSTVKGPILVRKKGSGLNPARHDACARVYSGHTAEGELDGIDFDGHDDQMGSWVGLVRLWCSQSAEGLTLVCGRSGDRENGRFFGMDLRREASVLLFVAVWFDSDERGGRGGKQRANEKGEMARFRECRILDDKIK